MPSWMMFAKATKSREGKTCAWSIWSGTDTNYILASRFSRQQICPSLLQVDFYWYFIDHENFQYWSNGDVVSHLHDSDFFTILVNRTNLNLDLQGKCLAANPQGTERKGGKKHCNRNNVYFLTLTSQLTKKVWITISSLFTIKSLLHFMYGSYTMSH